MILKKCLCVFASQLRQIKNKFLKLHFSFLSVVEGKESEKEKWRRKLPFKAHAVKVDSCRSQCRITDVFDAKIKVASTFESSNFLQLTKINN